MKTLKTAFLVYTFDEITEENAPTYTHWTDGLTMVVEKNGVKIELVGDEIEKLVKTLPRTFGEQY